MNRVSNRHATAADGKILVCQTGLSGGKTETSRARTGVGLHRNTWRRSTFCTDGLYFNFCSGKSSATDRERVPAHQHGSILGHGAPLSRKF